MYVFNEKKEVRRDSGLSGAAARTGRLRKTKSGY